MPPQEVFERLCVAWQVAALVAVDHLLLGNTGESCEKTLENLVGHIANVARTELVSLSDRNLEGDWRR